ncbi:cupin domain-containing protein [Muricauda brasiliensis]|uniref:cupin domain-containing protein n=1 Tax=Muricauda brasiliensis TaxID=2162892 RepID=UPI000D358D9A|nr:cupin domain-containing protein [Muricauda brasiliensis]
MKNNTSKWVLGQKVTLHPTTGDYDLVVCETPAGAQGPPPHVHSEYKEAFMVVQGELEFFVNGETFICKQGESVDIPPGTLHTFSNKTDTACTWVNIHSPKGFYKFFETFGIPETEEDAIMKSVEPEIIQKVLATASQYDMAIPPPPQH